MPEPTEPRRPRSGPDPDWVRAEQAIEARLPDGQPVGRRILAYETEERSLHPALAPVRRIDLSVLASGPDVVVFFDREDGLVGWRDDGRLGAPTRPSAPGPEVGQAVIAELELARAEVREQRPVFLDPLGWTYEVRVRAAIRGRAGAVRAWVEPASHRVIQVLSGRAFEVSDGAIEYRARLAMLELFESRLRRAGIRPKPAHRYVVLALKNVEGYGGGRKVRWATGRHWPAAGVETDGPEGPIVGWSLARLADPPARRSLPIASLIAAAARAAPPPAGASDPKARRIGQGDPVRSWQVTWRHRAEGVPVEGDFHQVEVHAELGRLIGVRTRWAPSLPSAVASLSAEEALRLALAARTERDLDPAMVPGTPALCFVRPLELAAPDHRLAWRVGFADAAGTADLYIDAVDGRVIATGGAR